MFHGAASLVLGLLSLSLAAEQKVLGDTKQNPFDKDFGSLVEQTLDRWNVPGIAIAVVDGTDIFAEGYGIATFPNTPVTPSTLFYAASTTKAFTAAAMSLLIDNSSQYSDIQWNTPISSLIRDDFVLENEYATTHTTIEDALSHRSGMPRHDLSYGGDYDGHPAGPETLSGFFSTRDAEAAPEHLARGYAYVNETYLPVRFMDVTFCSGAGSIISNVLDYAKWIRAHIHTSGPISKAGYHALKTSRIVVQDEDEDSAFIGASTYTLGWDSKVYKGYQLLEHDGGMEAYGSKVIYIPEASFGVVAFGNTARTSNIAELILAYKLIDDKLRIPEHERLDWTKTGRQVLEADEQRYKNAMKTFYPKVPSPALNQTLPLVNYTGTYVHPAYRNITLVLKDGVVHTDRVDVAWPLSADLKHVTGDHFMVYADSAVAPGGIFKLGTAAEFRIGSDGVPKHLGVAMEDMMGKDGRIWFERV